MDLPFLKNQKPQKNFFLALLIKPYKIGVILFEEINDKLFILSTSDTQTKKEANDLTEEELLSGADKVISFVEGSLPEGASVEKTIFSVPYDWIQDGKITKDYLLKLKKVCDDLGLMPMGYLVSIEAIIHFMQKSEGAPVSAIFLEVTSMRVFAYIVRASKVLEVQSQEVEGKVMKAIEALLKKIESVDVLPAKIVLLDYEDADGIQQEILSHSWPKEIPFLHLPQVIALEKGFENEATINGVAVQMELEVLPDVHKPIEEPVETAEIEEAQAAEFGFVQEEDVVKKTGVAKVEVVESPDVQAEESNIMPVKEEPDVNYFKEEEGLEEKEPLGSPDAADGILSFIKNFKIPTFPAFPAIPGLPQGFKAQPKSKLIAAALGLVIFIIAVSYFYYHFLLGATVTVFADKKAIDKSSKITFSQDVSTSDNIKISLVERDATGEDTKNSTGQKETGDKAKGEVTIYNKTEDDKAFPKGTIVVGPGGLEFQLQSDIKVASTSSFSTSLSSTKGKVEASKFGKEYNLPSGTNFTVKGFSTSQFIGKNENATTGGTKKTTTVVSQKDLDDLLSQITNKLAKDVVEQEKGKVSGDQDVFPQALSADVSSKKYTKKEGDESGSVGISAKITYSVGIYNKSDLDNVVKSLSEGQVPGSYSLLEGDSKIDITDIGVHKDKSASATLVVKAVYVPQIDPVKLANQIRGKSVKSAETTIKDITGVTDVNISLKRKIPIFPQLLPQNSKNISIEVKN